MLELSKREALRLGAAMLLCRPIPTEVHWLNYTVTYVCDARCIMCSIWKTYIDNPSLYKNELKLDEVQEFLESKYLSYLQGISFTGGEPFLRKDLVELTGLFMQKHPDALYSIATNGFHPEHIMRKVDDIMSCHHPKHLSISVSLDGVNDLHNQIRGKDVYGKVTKTVKLLASRGDINVGIDFTIMPMNYRDLWKVYEILKRYRVKFLAGFAHTSSIYYGNNTKSSFKWERDKLREVKVMIEKIIEDRMRNQRLMKKLTDPYDYFMIKSSKYMRVKQRLHTCYAGTHSLFLNPYGDIYPCVILDKKFGNIKEIPFDLMWTSTLAEQIRNHIRLRKCHCWIACDVVPSIIRSPILPLWNMMNKMLKP